MSGDGAGRGGRLAAFVLLVVLVAAFHGPSLRNGFVYDDLWTIVDNPILRRPANAFALLGPGPSRALVPDAGRPTLLWSEMVDFALWGLAPWGYHLQSVAWHAGVVLLFFSAAVGLGLGLGASLFAAAVVAVHPLHVEVVAAVNYREDLLATFFALLALSLVVAARRRGVGEGRRAGSGLRAAAGVALLVGALAKESAALAPLVLLLLDACLPAAACLPAGASFRARLRDYLVLGVPAAVAFMWRAWVMGTPAIVSRAAEIPDAHRDRLLTVPAAAGHFLAAVLQLVVPTGLKPTYDPDLPSADLAPTAGARLLGWCALAVVAAAVLVAWRARRRAPIVAFGVLAGVAAYLPHLGLVPLTNLRADRYLYASSLPLTLVLSVVVVDLLRRLDGGRGAEATGLSTAGRAVLVAAILALGVRSWSQGRVWRHDLALWTHATRVAPASAKAWAGRGAAHLRAGDTLRALEATRRSLALVDDARTRQLLGLVLLAQGDLQGAHRELSRAVGELQGPGRAEALNNLGHCAHRLGRLAEALAHFQAALALAPAFDRPWLNASRVHEERGEAERAIELVRELVLRIPESADAWRRLGGLLEKAGRAEEARAAQARARALYGSGSLPP